MEINTLAESQTANLKVNILLETREDGSAIASILEREYPNASKI